MTRAARFAALAGALALTTLLAACGGPTDPTPTGEPTSSASPTPTDGEADGGDERPMATDATCDDLVPEGSLASLFSTTLEPVGPERTPAYIATEIDESWIAQAAGGLACEWQDATSYVSSEGTSDYRGVRLLLAPAPHAGFAEYATNFPEPDDDVQDCGEGICRRDVYINGWWLSLLGYLFENEEYQTRALQQYDAIIARVRALPSPRSVPRDSTITDDCAALLPAAGVASALGVPASSVFVEGEFYLSFRTTVLSQRGGVSCIVAVDGTEIGIVETLPSGAWAEQSAVAAYLGIGGTEARLPIAGLSEPGSFRMQVDSNGFDFVTEGDWVKVITWNMGGPMTAEQISVGLATAVVAAR